MRKKGKKHLKGLAVCVCILLLGSAALTYAEQTMNVNGHYKAKFENVYTTVIKNTAGTLSLPEGQIVQILLWAPSEDNGVRLAVTPVKKSEADAYNWVQEQTGAKGKEPYAYYVAFYKGNTPKSLSDEAQITLSVPDGYSEGILWYMDSKGIMTQLAEVNGEKYIEATASGDGYYLFLNPLADSNHSGNSGGNGSTGSGSSSDSDSVTTTPGDQVVQDPQKGYMTQKGGIITGETGSMENDGYSHWIQDEKGWWLRFADGSWAQGEAGDANCHWEKVDGKWFAFGSDGYARFGWLNDTATGEWYYVDVNQGMKDGWHQDEKDGYSYYLDENGKMATGWKEINGKWSYFNPVVAAPTWEYDNEKHVWNHIQDAGRPYGSMYRNEKTPDGYQVDENGNWDEK